MGKNCYVSATLSGVTDWLGKPAGGDESTLFRRLLARDACQPWSDQALESLAPGMDAQAVFAKLLSAGSITVGHERPGEDRRGLEAFTSDMDSLVQAGAGVAALADDFGFVLAVSGYPAERAQDWVEAMLADARAAKSALVTRIHADASNPRNALALCVQAQPSVKSSALINLSRRLVRSYSTV